MNKYNIMEYYKIINPKTGRRVNLNGKIGKQILRNYIQEMNGGAKDTKVYIFKQLEDRNITLKSGPANGACIKYERDTIGGESIPMITVLEAGSSGLKAINYNRNGYIWEEGEKLFEKIKTAQDACCAIAKYKEFMSEDIVLFKSNGHRIKYGDNMVNQILHVFDNDDRDNAMIIGDVYRNDSDEGELELLSAINTLLLADEVIKGNSFIFTYGGQTAQFHNGITGGSCDMEEMGAENVSESEFKKQTGLTLLSKNIDKVNNIIFNSTWAFMMGPAAILNQKMDKLPENDSSSKSKMKQLILSTREPYFNYS